MRRDREGVAGWVRGRGRKETSVSIFVEQTRRFHIWHSRNGDPGPIFKPELLVCLYAFRERFRLDKTKLLTGSGATWPLSHFGASWIVFVTRLGPLIGQVTIIASPCLPYTPCIRSASKTCDHRSFKKWLSRLRSGGHSEFRRVEIKPESSDCNSVIVSPMPLTIIRAIKISRFSFLSIRHPERAIDQ